MSRILGGSKISLGREQMMTAIDHHVLLNVHERMKHHL